MMRRPLGGGALLVLALPEAVHAQAECHDMIRGAIDRCAADCAACHIDTVRPRPDPAVAQVTLSGRG